MPNSHLFTPIKLRNLTLANRIIVSPMCQYSAADGDAQDWHLIHYGKFALGGAGMLIIEASVVDKVGRISPHCLGIWSDQNEIALKNLITSIRKYSNMPIAIQLAHAGRKASTNKPWDGIKSLTTAEGGWDIVAPSAIAFNSNELLPNELTLAEIKKIPALFAKAVTRCHRIGIDAIELHNAHGYLLHSFLSPLSNKRTDEYGGSLENRMRLSLEVFTAMRVALPKDKPLGVRVSCTDWMDSGWDLEQTIAFATELKRRDCDWLDCSSGGLSPEQKIKIEPGYQVAFAEKIKKVTGITTIAVGLITEPEQAETILATGKADMIALGRSMLANPHWAWTAALQLNEQVTIPPQYNRAISFTKKDKK